MEPEGSQPWSREVPLIHIQVQMNPIDTLPSYVFKIDFNIILPASPTSYNGVLSSSFSPQPPHVFLFPPILFSSKSG